MRLANASLCLLLLVCSAPAADEPVGTLESHPFWKQMAGCWEGENTYFDSQLNYLIREYSSLVCIQLDGPRFSEVEHRFYPVGLGVSRYSQGLAAEGEGVEFVVTTTGSLADAAGTLGNIEMDQPGSSGPNVRYRVLGPDDGVRTNSNPQTGVDVYRMYFNFITPNRRLRSNVGIHKDQENIGDLRAFILYRDRRIDPQTFAARRAALRSRHNVTVLNEADPDDPGQSRVTRLD